ncbi:MAG TPA: hypothetical protein DD435_15505 [Cyanobacteria bacterium UBA8530]|nr:hypothetical protein [Cyanobacteria bacterium UBA8530]
MQEYPPIPYGFGDSLNDYLVRVSQLRPIMKKGSSGCFHIFQASNATGQLRAVIWADTVDFRNGDFLKITGKIQNHREEAQIVVNKWEVVRKGDIDPSYFLPTCSQPIERMLDEMIDYISQVQSSDMQMLLTTMLLDDPTIAIPFQQAPAAKFHHHAYLGGLLEHSLAVAKRALGMALEGHLNRDLILAGALLHDIGKIEEYSFIDSIEIVEIGNLAGHIALGYYMVRRAISRIPDFPSELATQLLHLILSHHGRNEWGSPVEPATSEALIVSAADLIDAQLFQLSRAGEDFPGERVTYSKSLNRWVLGNPHLPSQESYSYN